MDTLHHQSYNVSVKYIAAAKFKEQCLALLDSVGPEGLVITKRGKPGARLVRIDVEPSQRIGILDGKLRIKGDLLSTGLKWAASAES